MQGDVEEDVPIDDDESPHDEGVGTLPALSASIQTAASVLLNCAVRSAQGLPPASSTAHEESVQQGSQPEQCGPSCCLQAPNV